MQLIVFARFLSSNSSLDLDIFIAQESISTEFFPLRQKHFYPLPPRYRLQNIFLFYRHRKNIYVNLIHI